jgi:hypothetical protein
MMLAGAGEGVGMVALLAAYLGLACLAFLAIGFWTRGGFYAYPFLAAGMFATFVLPQIPGLAADKFIPAGYMERAVFFSLLCLLMCGAGWWLGTRTKAKWDWIFSEQRLLHYAALLSVVGAYFFHKFGELSDAERLVGFLSGAAVSYLFFARLLTYGLAIALLCFARRPSRLALAIIAFDCLFYFDRIVIAGRRGDAAEFFLMIALALWFQKRWPVPRWTGALGLVFALVGLLGAGDYRAATYYSGAPDWTAVSKIDLAANWNTLISQGGPEVRNLAFSMAYVESHEAYDYGADHWNTLVNSYVPAQLVGTALKQSLFLPVPPVYQPGYVPSPGTTQTGMMDAFISYWYFGALKFALIAALMGYIYTLAMRGNSAMQLLYMLSVMPSMLAITHFTNEVLVAWVHIFGFILPGLFYAKVRPPRTRMMPAARPLPAG